MTADEVLRENGYSEDEIKDLDPRTKKSVADAIAKSMSAAEARVAEAQEIERRYNQMYHTEIVPALNQWGSDKANLEAKAAEFQAQAEFYKKQNEGARSAGFIPQEAARWAAAQAAGAVPPAAMDQPRGNDGRYVAGGNPVPGSPGLAETFIRGISNAQWFSEQWGRLHQGEPLPEDYTFEGAWKDATSQGMEVKDYLGRKYKFAERQKEIDAKKAKDHDDAIVKATTEKVNREWAERNGANPNLRPASSSQFSKVRKAVESGGNGRWKDPVTINADQRRRQTNEMIHSQIAEEHSQGNA